MGKLLLEHDSGDVIEKVLLVRDKQLKTARTGKLYLDLELTDRSGALPAKVWDATRELFDSFGVDDFVEVKGRVETYRNQLQLNVVSLVPREPSEVDLTELLPHTTRDVDEMLAELEQYAQLVEQPKLRELLEAMLGDERICRGLRLAPAAVQYHHPFIGGLLEHTVGVCRLTCSVIEEHPELDADLLLTGAILHDIGKIDELVYDRTFRYGDQGNLLGHLIIGMLMIEEKVRTIEDFPSPLLDMLRHLILSHHGEYEWGSPKLPMTAEAIALHHIDNLDAKVNAFQRLVQQDRDPDSQWTEWSRMFGRRLYKWRGGDAGSE